MTSNGKPVARPISIHALREEGDCDIISRDAYARLFQSTPSARRATRCLRSQSRPPRYFNPRPPRGGRQKQKEAEEAKRQISIHALREEGDLRPRARPRLRRYISIHALREEGDEDEPLLGLVHLISIHALREEGDDLRHKGRARGSNFNPRPPRGGRQNVLEGVGRAGQISIHALREEGDDGKLVVYDEAHMISIHALREEGDAIPPQATGGILIFQSTPSARRATMRSSSKAR